MAWPRAVLPPVALLWGVLQQTVHLRAETLRLAPQSGAPSYEEWPLALQPLTARPVAGMPTAKLPASVALAEIPREAHLLEAHLPEALRQEGRLPVAPLSKALLPEVRPHVVKQPAEPLDEGQRAWAQSRGEWQSVA